MSTFAVNVVCISKVTDHPNADRLSLIHINGFAVVSAKLEDGSHRYKQGDFVIYVPEDSIVPEYLLRQGFWDEEKDKGILSGSNGDRVKAIRLRGIVSQGILFPVSNNVKFSGDERICTVYNENLDSLTVYEGDNIAEFLGITKYEPPIPVEMAGDVYNLGSTVPHFDVENLQKFPETFEDGQNVTVTEKLHGTCTIVGIRFNEINSELFTINNENYGFVTSKGLGAKGLVFKYTENNRKNNLYVKTVHASPLHLLERLSYMKDWFKYNEYPISGEVIGYDIIGEIYGPGVQDLHYGLKKPKYRAFSLRVHILNDNLGELKSFWAGDIKYKFFEDMTIDYVPVLYRGPFDLEKMKELRTGYSTDDPNQIREGIVITSSQDNNILEKDKMKFINPDYLTRKNKNATEYQ